MSMNLLAPLYSGVHTLLHLTGWLATGLALVALIGAVFIIFPRLWPPANAILLPIATAIGKYAGIFLDWLLADLQGGLPVLVSSGKTVVALIFVMALSAIAGVQYEKHQVDLKSPVPSNCKKVVAAIHKNFHLVPVGTHYKIIK